MVDRDVPRPAAKTVDAHVHLWDPNNLTYPWLAESVLRRRIDAAALMSATAGSDGFVVVQADCLPDESAAELAWLGAQRSVEPALLGAVAFAPIELGAQVADHVQRLADEPFVVGVRRLLQDEARGFALSPEFLSGLAVLRDAGLPFDACVRAHQLRDVAEFAERTPGLTVVLDHLGKPRVGHEPDSWRDDLLRLSRVPTAYCKLSGLGTETPDGRLDVDLVLPYLRTALDAFGPDRCMFGSDWPVMTLAGDYERWVEAVQQAVEPYGAAYRDAVFGQVADTVYRLTVRRVTPPARAAGHVRHGTETKEHA